MPSKKVHSFSPSRTVLYSIALTIIIGTLLLALPLARTRPLPLIDLFFTATSCTTVTGLMTVPMDSFTPFGMAIIMLLIQIGGLGLVTLSLFVVSLFVNLGLATQVMAGEMLDLDCWKNARKIIVFIISLTLIIEAIGAALIFQSIRHEFSLSKALFYSVFHSISAFCNAGITIFNDGMLHYTNNHILILTTALLMFLGGLGFITWRELTAKWNPFTFKKHHLSLQTKIILWYYTIFIIGNAFLFFLLESHNAFEDMSLPTQLTNALFTSVSARSGGYTTVFPTDLQHASLFNLLINAFIGSAPGSTGSGIKLTTFAIFLGTINAAILHKNSVDINGRRIMKDQVFKAIAVVALSGMWVIVTTFLLLLTEQSADFFSIFFETVSAFATLGTSLGLTPYLSITGKCLIMLSMLIGRIGSLTLIIALRKHYDISDFTYPEERVMIT